MKKTKQPGENISLKTKKTEDPFIMQWINAQTNLMDSLRYLMEHEIVLNGVRNLQTVIPMERNVILRAEARPAGAGSGVGWTAHSELAAGRETDALQTEADAEPADLPEEEVIDEDIDEEDIDSWT